jgi:HK97 family phage portal protein
MRSWWAGITGTAEVLEKASATPAKLPDRAGYEYGVPNSGLTEYNSRIGGTTGTDRRSMLTQLNEAYLACTWSWASVNAISRTITAGGLVMDWDGNDGEGDQETPTKPAEVIALERMLAYCNPAEDIRQILRGVITDLEVFGDAYLEVVRVGAQPVALYSLDCPSMAPITDAHGQVIRYVQVTELGQRAEFEPEDVIHISLDAPRSAVFGVSPTQAALLPIMGWLFAAATSKELFKKGNPATIHVDMPAGSSPSEMNRWVAQHMTRNIGPKNIGAPIMTRGGATVHEINSSRTVDYLAYLDQRRDEILASYGVPPAQVGVIETGNLGGSSGESQYKTFLVNTCQPLGELVLEKLNWHLTRLGFGIQGWKLKFDSVDMRDSKTIEEIRDIRLRNGAWTLDRYRADIGEPPTEGGDTAVLVDRSLVILWRDMEDMSAATVAAKGAPALAASEHQATLQAEPAPTAAPPLPAEDPPGGTPQETHRLEYRRRLREALAALPGEDIGELAA